MQKTAEKDQMQNKLSGESENFLQVSLLGRKRRKQRWSNFSVRNFDNSPKSADLLKKHQNLENALTSNYFQSSSRSSSPSHNLAGQRS